MTSIRRMDRIKQHIAEALAQGFGAYGHIGGFVNIYKFAEKSHRKWVNHSCDMAKHTLKSAEVRA